MNSPRQLIAIFNLGKDDVIEKIKPKLYVKYRNGIWNQRGSKQQPYETVKTEIAIEGISSSKYGADLYAGLDGYYYVSCPTESDMKEK